MIHPPTCDLPVTVQKDNVHIACNYCVLLEFFCFIKLACIVNLLFVSFINSISLGVCVWGKSIKYRVHNYSFRYPQGALKHIPWGCGGRGIAGYLAVKWNEKTSKTEIKMFQL